MPCLERVPHDPVAVEPPAPVGAFLSEAGRRMEAFRTAREDERIPSFVASNAWVAWHALTRIREEGLAPGNSFLEWGSGFGVVTGLAALAGFQARGIEIEPTLVARSRDLLAEFGVGAVVAEGTYLPPGTFTDDIRIDTFAPAEADIVYVYPWPAEEHVVREVFRRFGRDGALLVTHSGGTGLRIHRRVG